MLMYSLVFIRVFVRLYSGELSAAPVPDYTCHPPQGWAERFFDWQLALSCKGWRNFNAA